jgi:hypothetical protein
MISSEPRPGERIVGVEIGEDTLAVSLADGRTIIVPLAWYPRLVHATKDQRNHWLLAGAGFGIHWPDLDEDLSVSGFLNGLPARGAQVSLPSVR